MNIYNLISRAQKLRKETQLDSVSPDRVGGLQEDTLKYINEFQLLASSPSLHKIYASVSAMQSDKSPKSDLTGKPLKSGQLVVIVPANQTDATAGDVYRYDGPSGNTSAWTFVAKIGAVPADAELSATSTNPVQNKVVTEKLTELESKSHYDLICNGDPEWSNLRISGRVLTINPKGFGIVVNRKPYYVASIDVNRVEDYKFTINSNDFLVVNIDALVNQGARNEVADVLSTTSNPTKTQIPIAYAYESTASFVGRFADLYGQETNIQQKKYDFLPQHYAFKYGRKNNDYGVGQSWKKRFSILHISDSHAYYNLLSEASLLTREHIDVMVNTGDDANGVSSNDASLVKSVLTNVVNSVSKYNQVPYASTPGNHDVTGLTKKEYYDIICAYIKTTASFVSWGNASGHRAYGYMDFTQYESPYRVIILDPFDYDDGQFETIYQFSAAVFSQKQVDWFINVLVDAAEKGYNVITMMHYSFGDGNYASDDVAYSDANYYQDEFMLPDIVDALQHSSVLKKDYRDSQGIHNVSVDKDFSDVPRLNYICHLYGHIHSYDHFQCQKADGTKKYDMLMLGSASLSDSGVARSKIHKIPGTINDISCSSIHIDLDENAIYRVRYGAYFEYNNPDSKRTERIPFRFRL